ncbi:uncharacterized protein DCS_04616 [Drechmeria coniospora]|uniref:Uncharacterized protein n=1 Tax=Drechmeria coniospora TaxID=98403 RepID=A0A151GKH0_DRECN|nr:uncharacterized protein DCS_04616 [Drechmeria coniospora]KYK57605.1 uncharacterized protein DCS_04616 [Drechmeria coniospora]
MLKLTSVFIGAFFCFVVVPAYAKSEKPLTDATGVVLCGILPIIFVSYTTAPFVTHIHMHLPPAARTSRAVLERFVAALPPSTPLTMTTMSLIAKPRYSSLNAGDLAPVSKRFGLVNYVRDTANENKARSWYNHRAVSQFYVQSGGADVKKTTKSHRPGTRKRGVVDVWIWDALREKLAKRAAFTMGSAKCDRV